MRPAQTFRTRREELPSIIKFLLQQSKLDNIQFIIENPSVRDVHRGCIMNLNFMINSSEEDWQYFNKETYTEIKEFALCANGPVYVGVNSNGYMKLWYSVTV